MSIGKWGVLGGAGGNRTPQLDAMRERLGGAGGRKKEVVQCR